MDTAVLVLVQTITLLTVLFPINASSITPFNGMSFAPLKAPSQVIIQVALASSNLSAILCAEKPPNITLCMAPILAQANTAIANSGIMPI